MLIFFLLFFFFFFFLSSLLLYCSFFIASADTTFVLGSVFFYESAFTCTNVILSVCEAGRREISSGRPRSGPIACYCLARLLPRLFTAPRRKPLAQSALEHCTLGTFSALQVPTPHLLQRHAILISRLVRPDVGRLGPQTASSSPGAPGRSRALPGLTSRVPSRACTSPAGPVPVALAARCSSLVFFLLFPPSHALTLHVDAAPPPRSEHRPKRRKIGYPNKRTREYPSRWRQALTADSTARHSACRLHRWLVTGQGAKGHQCTDLLSACRQSPRHDCLDAHPQMCWGSRGTL